MAGLIQPARCMLQPQQASEVDYSNTLANGLVDAWVGSNPYYHSAFGTPQGLTPTSGPTRAYSAQGVGLQFDGSAQYISRNGSSITSTAEATLLVIAIPSNTAAATKSIFGYGNSGSANQLLFIGQGATSGQLSFFARSDANTSQNLQVTAPAAWTNGGAPCVLVGTRSEAKNFHRIYCNGVSISPTTGTALGTSTFNRTTIGGLVRNSAGLLWSGSVYLALSWNRALDDSEVRAISLNPWGLFKPQAPRIIVSVASSGVAGDISWTEADDSASIAGTLTDAGTIAWTEANDTVSVAGALTVSGSAAWTEADDTFAIVGSLPLSAAIAWTEPDDAISIQGSLATVIVVDTHDGGEEPRKRKREEEWRKEREARDRRKQDLRDLFDGPSEEQEAVEREPVKTLAPSAFAPRPTKNDVRRLAKALRQEKSKQTASPVVYVAPVRYAMPAQAREVADDFDEIEQDDEEILLLL